MIFVGSNCLIDIISACPCKTNYLLTHMLTYSIHQYHFFLPYSSSGLCRRKLLATISLHDAAMVADTALEQNEFGGTLQGDPKGSSAGQEAGL